MRLSSIIVMRWVIVFAAILLWVNIYGFLAQPKSLPAPLVVENLNPSFSIAEPITTVTARISGGLRDLSNVNDSNLKFAIDASQITGSGSYTLAITPRPLPPRIKLLGYSPQEIKINVEPTATKIVPVVALTTGSPQNGYSVKTVSPIPAQVEVVGAKSLLDTISEARSYVNVAHHASSFILPATVVVEGDSRYPITSVATRPAIVKVNVEISAGGVVRNLGLKPSFIGELPGGFWVQEVKFEPSVIQVRGQQTILDGLTSLTSTPINLANHRSSFNDQVAVNLPSGVEMVGENLVMAHIVVGSSEGTRQFDITPEYVNVTEGFSVTASTPSTIQVVVSGDPKLINQLKRSDIKLNLDLAGTLSGPNTITITPAMFSLPSNFQVVSFTPDQVEVVLTRL